MQFEQNPSKTKMKTPMHEKQTGIFQHKKHLLETRIVKITAERPQNTVYQLQSHTYTALPRVCWALCNVMAPLLTLTKLKLGCSSLRHLLLSAKL